MMMYGGDPISWGIAHLATRDWKKSWRSTTTPQKLVQLGLVGGLIGTAIYYLYVDSQRAAPGAPPQTPPVRTASAPDRGTYR